MSERDPMVNVSFKEPNCGVAAASSLAKPLPQ